MTRTPAPDDERTPQGGLQEAGIHGLLGYRLAQAAILTSQAFVSAVGKPLGLRMVEFTVLHLIRENDPVTATKLAKALAVTSPAVTAWLDQLEARGLVRRERDEADRRSQHVRITPKGDELVTLALSRLLHADGEILDSLSQGERHMLLELLAKVARSRRR